MSSDLHMLIALGEAPIPLLSTRIKTFIDAVEYSTHEYGKVRAAVCLFDFIRLHSDLIKNHYPTLTKVILMKADEFMEASNIGEGDAYCELYDMCVDVHLLMKDPMIPSPPPSSNAAGAPGAPLKGEKPRESESPKVAGGLLASSSEVEDVMRQLFFPIHGNIYRGVFASEGMKSSVKCMPDGSLLEIRRGDKTGRALEKANRKKWASWDMWQKTLANV